MWSESVDNQGESIFNHHVKQCLTHLEADFVVCLPSDLCGMPSMPNNENVT